MMRILVLSDTHIPRSAHDIPQGIYDVISGVDMIFHAGDFVEESVLEKLNTLKPTKAVCGNMDSGKLQHILKKKEVVLVEKARIGIIHGYGAPASIAETVMGEFKDVDAIVFGHSHAPLNIVKDGVLLFNPGSPTDTVFAKVNSYGILEVNGSSVKGEIVEL